MKRQDGFYWVKTASYEEWEIAQFGDNFWLITGCENNYSDAMLYYINELRILNPDEI